MIQIIKKEAAAFLMLKPVGKRKAEAFHKSQELSLPN